MIPDLQDAVWPGWETVGILGQGSYGAVYEIRRDVFGETEKAALKVISIPQSKRELDEMYSEGHDDISIHKSLQSQLKSILSEYSLMRKLNGCANVVHCDDMRYEPKPDGIGWNIYIKMELLTPLSQTLTATISDETVIRIGKDMCRALERCSMYDIIHRDIKPQNMFVSDAGDYKLGDFGIAKTVERTMGGTKIGTFKYMAPEVFNNQPYGSAADIYSLGLVLYWLLNERRLPFVPLPPAPVLAGADGNAANKRFTGVPIPAPKNGSEALKRIVLKACAFHPKDRYADASALWQALDSVNSKSVFVAATPDEDLTKTVRVRPIPDDRVSTRHAVTPVDPSTSAKPVYHPSTPSPYQEYAPKRKSKLSMLLILCVFITALMIGLAILIHSMNSDKLPTAQSPVSTMPKVESTIGTIPPQVNDDLPVLPVESEPTTETNPTQPPEEPETFPIIQQPSEPEPTPVETDPPLIKPVIQPYCYEYNSMENLYADLDGDGINDTVIAEELEDGKMTVNIFTSSSGNIAFSTYNAFKSIGQLIGADLGDGSVTLTLTIAATMTAPYVHAYVYKIVDGSFQLMKNVDLEMEMFTGSSNGSGSAVTVETIFHNIYTYQIDPADEAIVYTEIDSYLHDVKYVYNAETGCYDLVTVTNLYCGFHRRILLQGYTRYVLDGNTLTPVEQWVELF